ncbi:hypothetical protein [Agrobacterium tumefaciens]|uniref:hypothetical protein n=1 Tax=Agrobacterium TaxID=357 RepID=UPI003B9E2A2E
MAGDGGCRIRKILDRFSLGKACILSIDPARLPDEPHEAGYYDVEFELVGDSGNSAVIMQGTIALPSFRRNVTGTITRFVGIYVNPEPEASDGLVNIIRFGKRLADNDVEKIQGLKRF